MGEGTEIAIMLRRQLRQRRKDLGMSQQGVAEAISGDPRAEGSVTKQAVGKWERFIDQPRIDAFAAWARAVGLRLHVQLYDPAVDRVTVQVPAQAADLCAILADLTAEEIGHLRQTAALLARNRATEDPTLD